jgi:hypothetical protein
MRAARASRIYCFTASPTQPEANREISALSMLVSTATALCPSGAVALVFAGHGAGLAWLERQAGPGSVDGLDLMGWMAPFGYETVAVL